MLLLGTQTLTQLVLLFLTHTETVQQNGTDILLCLLLDHLWVLLPDVLMVIASEVAVDVVKHAFITKFNDISADVSAKGILFIQLNELFIPFFKRKK